ncbi:MAG TPA: aspartyl protease family protein [Cyclobacteriaceae bacterium]|nr:aspartyl protease family protein [Cyclobacteriaceae bacterium]
MKTFIKKMTCQLVIMLLTCSNLLYATSPSGFYLPEPIEQVTIRYTCINNLIVLPLVINGNLKVNLVLDTGTRNIVLFGKRFEKLLEFVPNRNVQFTGMGTGKQVYGKLSIDNQVKLTSLIGERISLVVVPNKNVFINTPKVDGIIGYDIFQKFEVEIDPKQKFITFRSPDSRFAPSGFTHIPLRIENTRPIIDSEFLLENGTNLITNLMIDTGSQLSFLLKTTNESLLNSTFPEVLGFGMSGSIEGIKTMAQTINLAGINFQNQSTGIIRSEWHNYGSMGMGILKEYALIINYSGAYACLKKLQFTK